MAQLASQVAALELERVEDRLATLFDYDDTFYREIEKATDAEVVSSRDMRIPLEIRPGGNFGHFDPDGGDLGLGDGPTYDKALISVVYLKHGIQWTKKSEWVTDDKRKAVLNSMRRLLAKGMADFRRRVDSLCMTAGDGVLGTISAVTINTPAGSDTITLNSDGFRAKLLRFGQTINVYDATLATNRTVGAEKKITYYDLATKQIRIPTGTAGIVATDKIVVAGLSATPPVSLLGVKYHHNGASTGSWLGLDRATTPEIRGNEVAAGGALALSHARLAIAKVGDRVGKEALKGVQAWTHPAQVQAYEELGNLTTVINAGGNRGNQGLDLYWDIDNVKIAGVPVKTHWAWDRTRIDFIVKSAWGRAVMKEAGTYEVDGKRIFELRGASGGVATSQIFYLMIAFNLFMRNPTQGAFISGLTIPTGY